MPAVIPVYLLVGSYSVGSTHEVPAGALLRLCMYHPHVCAAQTLILAGVLCLVLDCLARTLGFEMGTQCVQELGVLIKVQMSICVLTAVVTLILGIEAALHSISLA